MGQVGGRCCLHTGPTGGVDCWLGGESVQLLPPLAHGKDAEDCQSWAGAGRATNKQTNKQPFLLALRKAHPAFICSDPKISCL